MHITEQLEQLRGLDDDGLLRSLKRHVGSESRLTALVLAHLAEVDARGAYRQWACETLVAYCIYELRFSEDEAQRRCRAARVARQFPVLFDMLADGSIHLTGILLLAPHLTAENHRDLLARARYRRKREIERLVAELAPARDVPALIEPLRPDPRGAPRAGNTWAALVQSNAGWVRHLQAGDGPAQAPSAPDAWHTSLLAALEDRASTAAGESTPESALAATHSAAHDAETAPPPTTGSAETTDTTAASMTAGSATTADGDRHAAATLAVVARELPRAMRYRVQFTADQSYVDLLERARDLLWHRLPGGDLAELQRLALEALVEKLMRRKYGGAVPRPQTEGETSAYAEAADAAGAQPCRPVTEHAEASAPGHLIDAARREVSSDAHAARAYGRAEVPAPDSVPSGTAAPARRERNRLSVPRSAAGGVAAPAPRAQSPESEGARASRYIPAAVRREVWQRDDGRCTFRDARGVRCRATRALELHHEQAFARGGASCVENLSLRCRSHNELAAERDFGRELVRAMKHCDPR